MAALLVNPDMSVLEQREIPGDLVAPDARLIRSFGLDVWVYGGADWYVPDPAGPHVARETCHRALRAEGLGRAAIDAHQRRRQDRGGER